MLLFLFTMSTEASFLEYWPSCIAAAAILCAASEIPNLSLANPEHAESWCDGLHKVSMCLTIVGYGWDLLLLIFFF
jgi:hypothetical protein